MKHFNNGDIFVFCDHFRIHFSKQMHIVGLNVFRNCYGHYELHLSLIPF